MRNLTWKTLSSTYVNKAPWAVLRKDVCEMPDGRIKPEYYVLEYPNWSNAVALTEAGKIILVRQYRHAAQIVSLELPGGVIEPGEAPEVGIKRELLEETGYQFNDVEQLAVVYANPATGDNHTYCYLAKNGKKVQGQSLDEHEDIIVEEYTIAEVKQLLAENKIAQALHCTNLFYALMKLGRNTVLTGCITYFKFWCFVSKLAFDMRQILDIPRTAMEVFNMLPEGTRCEVIDNTIYMSPSPTTDHQRLLFKIARFFENFAEANNLGEVFISPCDVYLTNETDVVQPDILFVSEANKSVVEKRGIVGSPDIIIELLSTNTKYDTQKKFEFYQKNSVPEYIMIDPETKDVWHYKLVNGRYTKIEQSENSLLRLDDLNVEIKF